MSKRYSRTVNMINNLERKRSLDPQKSSFFRKFLVNEMLSRTAFSHSLDPNTDRNLDRECGWIEHEPCIQDYVSLYEREGVAQRVVNVYPEESWSVYPELYEKEKQGPTGTAFERAFREFEYEYDPWHYLYRVDMISGIGMFGILLIGLNDGKRLDQPVDGLDENGLTKSKAKEQDKDLQVTYLQPYSQDLVTISELETSEASPRFGLPRYYNIKTYDPTTSMGVVASDGTTVYKELRVHWTRVIHVADNRKASRIYGTPRMRPVINRMHDIRKILGSSAEMFWQGAFPGFSLETLPGWEDSDFDMDSAKEEFEAWRNGLQRYMRYQGLTVKSLAPQAVDPSNHLMSQYDYVCASIEIPKNVFFGSEIGQLTGEETGKMWNRRLAGRQNKYLTRQLCFPFYKRLQNMRVLPMTDSLILKWKDFNFLTEKEKADVMVKKAQTLLQYVTSGAEVVFPVREFLTIVFDMSDEQADAIIESAKLNTKPVTKELWDPMAGSTPESSGKDPSKSTGMSGQRNSQTKKKGK